VLPCIRKHGAYATPDTLENFKGNPQFAEALIDALAEEHSKNVSLANKVNELTPRAHYCDMVLLSDQAIPTCMWFISQSSKKKSCGQRNAKTLHLSTRGFLNYQALYEGLLKKV